MFKTILPVLILVTCFAIPSWAKYSLIPVRSISGGKLDQGGNAHFDVEYWTSHCPNQTVKILLADAPPPAPTTNDTKYQTVGILLHRSHLACPGAQMKVVAHVVVAGPLPSGGAALYALQHEDIINFALGAPETTAEFASRTPSEISVDETAGFNKVYTVNIKSVEAGLAPNGISTHPCFTKVVVNVLSGVAGPVTQFDSVKTVCAMNSPIHH